jgi:hypothetical protein
VRAQVEDLFTQGVTEFVAIAYSNRDATLDVLRELL